jgi:16S rRNA (cytidine1402-2'-O)-methyltransferase
MSLTLIPTPIHETLPLEGVALDLLRNHANDSSVLLLVEEHKVARIRWLKWGLPRESIERFQIFNEHNQEKMIPEILQALKSGRKAFLMSDGGLPAFCDPGQKLVNACHEQGIKVTATPFPNSIALAIALSGFPHSSFYFAGFLPAEAKERKLSIEKIGNREDGAIILMDTPYRLQALLKDLAQSTLRNRKIFLGINLNSPEEKLFQGPMNQVIQKVGDLNKVEFVLVVRGKT